MMIRVTGKNLNDEWNVSANHALYHRDGDWYHYLTRFPGAMFDPNGYILFETKEDYENCNYLIFGEHVHVVGNLSNIPGYVRMRK